LDRNCMIPTSEDGKRSTGSKNKSVNPILLDDVISTLGPTIWRDSCQYNLRHRAVSLAARGMCMGNDHSGADLHIFFTCIKSRVCARFCNVTLMKKNRTRRIIIERGESKPTELVRRERRGEAQ